MTDPRPVDGLDALLATRTRALVKAAETDGRAPDEAAMAELERLSKLAELRKPRRRPDWLGVEIVLGVFALVSAAYALRLGSTSVSAEVVAVELGFTLGGTQPVVVGERLGYLSISGLDSLVVPVDAGRTETIRARSVVLRPDSAAGAQATIDLAQADLQAGTLVRVRAAGTSGRFAWHIDHPDAASRTLEHRVSLSGAVVVQAGGRTIPLRHEVGALLTAWSSAPLVIMTGYADTAVRVLPPISDAHRLVFDRSYRFQDVERAVSTIRGGSLTFEDLNGREMKLGPGQALRMDTADVEVPYLALAGNQLRVRFSGDVGGMRTGARGRHSLMPRWLEYLQMHPAIVLISTVFFTLVGYAAGIRSWWRRGS